MGALFSRIKTWVSTEDVSYSDLNAEFDNILTNLTLANVDDYSASVSQMQTTTDPGEVGTESLATTAAGEIARLRHLIAEITGEDDWYESPVSSLLGLSNAIGTGLTDNRIVSGAIAGSGSSQPIFLKANGAARTVTVSGSTTNFVYYVNGIEYTMTTDVNLTGLTAAPSSNNTCLIDDSVAADDTYTKHTGEDGSPIPVDNMGTEIQSLVGKFAAFKIAGVSTEYFIAYVESTTSLTRAYRGYFFDSTNTPVARTGYTNNDTITLMKLTWVFAKTDGTLTATYNNPIYSKTEPSSPSLGDYWYDLDNNTWKTYGVGSYTAANAHLIGLCIQDATNTVAARSFEFFKNYSDLNTVELSYDSATQLKSKFPGSNCNVWGATIKNEHNLHIWDITSDLDSGVTEGASTTYYCYLTQSGDTIISDVKPHDRKADLRAYYHPHKSWRCVGSFYNNASSNIDSSKISSYFYSEEFSALDSVVTTDLLALNQETIVLSGSSFTLTLPDAKNQKGKKLKLIHSGTSITNLYTLATVYSQTVGGVASGSYILSTAGETLDLVSDNSNWIISDHKTSMAWTSYTPTLVGFGTTSSLSFYYSRSGQNLLILGKFSTGTHTAVSAEFPLPTGLTVNSTVVPSIRRVGDLSTSWAAANNFTLLATANAAFLTLGRNDSAASGLSSLNANTIGNSVDIAVQITVPVNEWQP